LEKFRQYQHQQEINEILDGESNAHGQWFTELPEGVPANLQRRPAGWIENQKRQRHDHQQRDGAGGFGLAAGAFGRCEQIVQIPNSVEREHNRREDEERHQGGEPIEMRENHEHENADRLEDETKAVGTVSSASASANGETGSVRKPTR